MARDIQISINGVLNTVTDFSSSAQAIDDAVAVLGAPTTPQAALAALGAGVKPNLLINPYYINQRGQKSYSGAGYGIDGAYLLSGATQTVNADGSITVGKSGSSNISTYFLSGITDWDDLAHKTVSIAILDTSGNLYTLSTQIPAEQTSPIASQNTSFGAISLAFSTQRGFLLSVSPTNSSVTIPRGGMKLEEGSNQTLAYQDSTGAWHRLPQPEDGDPQAQLEKCEYYHKRFSSQFCVVGFGFASTATQLIGLISLPNHMRISKPTVTLSGSIYAVSPLGIGASSIEITIQPTNVLILPLQNLMFLAFNTTGLGITAGTPVILQIRDTTSYLDIAADL